MHLPEPLTIPAIDSISPSVYEAALQCLARASWVASGDRSALPPNPRSLLGIGLHGVLERAVRSGFPGTTEEQRTEEAAEHFDQELKALFQSAHPLVRAKFGNQERLPFYYLYRARATRIASQMRRVHSRIATSEDAQGHRRRRLAESTLNSRDQVIRGRPDLIDVADAAVVDYKTGSAHDSQQPTDSEARQLKLYAYLALENGISIRKGAVVHANRNRTEMPISRKEAEDEGRRARQAFEKLKRFSGKSFREAASPSPQACRYCPAFRSARHSGRHQFPAGRNSPAFTLKAS